MSFFMAIGGGSFQRGETRKLDAYLIQKAGKPSPHVLFLPTASKDDQGYAKRFKQYYRSLGCEVEALRLLHTKLNHEEIKEKILACDILYFGGGNLSFLIQTLVQRQLNEVICDAYEKGILCAGYSAGASLFYTYGYSDLKDDKSAFGYVRGLDLVHGVFCPHAQQVERVNFFEKEAFPQLPHYACADNMAYLTEDGNTRPYY